MRSWTCFCRSSTPRHAARTACVFVVSACFVARKRDIGRRRVALTTWAHPFPVHFLLSPVPPTPSSAHPRAVSSRQPPPTLRRLLVFEPVCRLNPPVLGRESFGCMVPGCLEASCGCCVECRPPDILQRVCVCVRVCAVHTTHTMHSLLWLCVIHVLLLALSCRRRLCAVVFLCKPTFDCLVARVVTLPSV